MFKIGNVKINSTTVLAPMAGITTSSYRTFMRAFGVGLTYTEMVSDHGLVYHNEKTIELLKSRSDDHPLAIQLFGNDEKTLVEAIKVIDELNVQYEILDINLACPVPKVTKAGSGSAMLKDLDKLERVMEAVIKASKKPVTAKIRLGYDNDNINFQETIEILTKVGVKAVALHARTRNEMYSGKAHYEYLSDLQEKMTIPLIISGDIFTLEDAIRTKEITKAQGVMIARGGIGNPQLIEDIENYFSGKPIESKKDFHKQIDYLIRFMDLLIEEKGEERAIRMLRGIAPRFIRFVPKFRHYRNHLSMKIKTRKDVIEILDLITSENSEIK